MLLVPTALAASFEASRLDISGAATVESDLTAFFVVAGESGFIWQATAEDVVLERRWRDVPLVVQHPLMPEHDLAEEKGEPQEETLFLGPARLHSAATPDGSAILARGAADTRALLNATGALHIEAEPDPRVDQGDPATAQVGESPVETIHESFSGDFLVLDSEDGAVTIVGDVVIDVYGVEYVVESEEGTSEQQTGRFTLTSAGPVRQEREERHRLRLTGATVEIIAPGASSMLAKFPRLSVQGEMDVDGADAALIPVGVPVDLASDRQRVLATTPDVAVATGGAIVGAAPSGLMLGVAGVALVAGALLGVLLWRRRAREDDLDAALLAMEERRWEDALPRLARVARKRPHDAGVLVDRALCLEQVGRFEEAARGFEAALRAAPQHAEAHFYYARTLAKMRQTEAARVHLEAALERDPRLVELARGEAVLRGL